MHRRSERAERGEFLIEGPQAVREALASPIAVKEVFLTDDLPGATEIRALAAARGAAVYEATSTVIGAVASTTTPQGAVAVAEVPQTELSDALEGADLVLVADQIQDPGNAGTLIRSAAAAGAGAILFTGGSVDPFNPKTVRASSGALFGAPLVAGVDLQAAAEALRARGFTLVGAAVRGGEPYDSLELTGHVAVVLGNEASGLDPRSRDTVDVLATIPMPGGAESLNVAVAGSILFFEVVRQRRNATWAGVRSQAEDDREGDARS